MTRQLGFLNLLTLLSIWIGAFIGLLGIIQTVALHMGKNLAIGSYQRAFLTTYGRPSGLEAEPNWFGIYEGMVLAIAFPFWTRKRKLGKLPINIIVISILGISVLLSGTRSIWVGLLVAFSLTNLINYRLWGRKLSRLISITLMMLVVIAFLLILNPNIVKPLNRIGITFDASEISSVLRVNTWRKAYETILQRPWTGYGLNSWQVLSLQYPPVNYMPTIISGKSVPNIFLDNWMTAGILGLLAIIYFIGYYSLKLIKLVRYRKDPLASTYGEAMLEGWITIVVASIFTNAFIHIFFWFAVALIIATLAHYRRFLHSIQVK